MSQATGISTQWAIAVGLGFPLLLLLVNESYHRAARGGSRLVSALRTTRALLLPFAGIATLLVLVLRLPQTEPLVRLVLTVLWITVLFVALQLVNDVLFGASQGDSWRAKVPHFFRDIARFAVVGVGAALIYSRIWGYELEGALTALGVGSLVIGLALQEPLGNIFSGVMLLAERPVSEGEWITVDGQSGRVVEMNWRAVKMETSTLETIVVPNSALYRTSFANLSRPTPHRTFTVELAFGRDVPPNTVKQVLRELARDLPGVLAEPGPLVRTQRLESFQVVYDVLITVAAQEDLDRVRDEFLTRTWYANRRHDLTPVSGATLTPQSVLARFPAFQDCTSLASLEMRVRAYAVGEALLQQGDEQDGLCVLLSGLAVLTVTDRHGAASEVGVLGVGDYYGEHSVLVGSVSSLALRALSDCEVAHFDLESSRRLMEHSPRLARDLGETIDRRRAAVSAVQRPGT